MRIARDVRAAVSETGLRLLNQLVALGCEPVAETAWTAPAEVDDRTVDYLLSVRRGFEALRDAARGLAALLILEASGARAVRPPGALPRPQRPRGGGGRDPSWPADAASRSSAPSSRGLGRSAGRGGGRHVEGQGHRRAPDAVASARGSRPSALSEARPAGLRDRGAWRQLRLLRGSEELSAADGDLFDLAGIRLRAWRGSRSDRLRGLRQAAPQAALPLYPAAGSRRCGHG